MSKELEAFHKIMETYGNTNSLEGTYDNFLTIKKALQRLEMIDSSKLSDALEYLEENLEYYSKPICDGSMVKNEYVGDYWHYCINNEKIKDVLLKVQEQEDKAKAFNLIDVKNVDIKLLKWAYPSVEAYNVKVREHKDSFPREELTKEEFEFLGRMVGAK